MESRSFARGALGLVAALLACLCLVGPAAAQESAPTSVDIPPLASLEVAIWPEYDRSEVLVIYFGEFASDVSLPLAVEWRIPAAAGEPSAVAAQDPDQGLVNVAYTTRLEGEWLVVSFELPTFGFQVEYYAPYGVSGGERTYRFTYPGDYPVAAFSLEAQVPPTAKGFVLEPQADSQTDRSGVRYHLVAAAPVRKGESRSWTVRYGKSDALLTQATPVSEPVEPTASGSAAAASGNSTAWIFLIAFIALVAVGAGAFWLGRRASISGDQDSESDRLGYCHVCGARLPSDARYCPKCSAAVRNR